ncbi:MAG: hypothetical protein Q9220_001962 [cf. Caloplaca sp. 1 TL-2023]
MESESHDAASARHYEAAQSMLQHARTPRDQQMALNGMVIPKAQLTQNDPSPQSDRLPIIPISPYHNYTTANQRPYSERGHVYDALLDSRFNRSHEPKPLIDQHGQHAHTAVSSIGTSLGGYPQHTTHSGSVKQSRPTEHSGPSSPASSRGFASKGTPNSQNSLRQISKKSGKRAALVKEEDARPPAWSDLKTKAGKDRKRLPLACIACRRKKIRCSGEKPACKHCLRSRIPCVYKVTTRKAAPRTDYMAMLDKRLKRMEERVIKILPGGEHRNVLATGRANVRPQSSPRDAQIFGGKKRTADEAFALDPHQWAHSPSSKPPIQGHDSAQANTSLEGADKLPSQKMQEHLADVYFDCLYGQSYYLLHKPSFMRRLRAGNAPPILVLAVCAIAARFSTHPEINTEPSFLRGEEWAASARELALKRYDQPSITLLQVLLILGLHEFGTCQGGRSWMFGGMAMRMAYALQLHQEWDCDPSNQKGEADPKFSETDREIRRRTMWSCFLMDRFNSSGTERPTCGAEEFIKIHLPTKEFNFQHEIVAPTETLDGRTAIAALADTGQKVIPRDNMGVAAYVVRAIVLWGRVIAYLNLGGKSQDPFPMWQPQSQFAELKKQVEDFKASLPQDLEYNADNLASHAAEKLANQFVLLHIVYHQVVLFLNRHAIPITSGAITPGDVPKEFQSAAAQVVVKAAEEISNLIGHASEHNVVAPFVGYCAFTSSMVHIWSLSSPHPSVQASAKQKLGENISYIGKMKRYWGIFWCMLDNLKDTWKRYHDHALQKGTDASNTASPDASLLQYGDWFRKYPNGVSKTDYEDPATKIKEEGNDEAALNQQTDLQTVDHVLFKKSPPKARTPPTAGGRKASKKQPRASSKLQTQQAHPPQVLPPPQETPPETPIHPMVPMPPQQIPITPSPFSPQHQLSQGFYPAHPPLLYEMYPPQPADMTVFPRMDRNMVYDAYARTSGPPTSSIDPTFQPSSMPVGEQSGAAMWDNNMGEMVGGGGADAYLGDFQQSSAWFMPFNMPPPTGFSPADGLGALYGGFGSNGNGMGDGGGGVGGDGP